MICQYLKWREIHQTFVVCTGFYECTRMERSDLWVGLLARDVPWAYELRRNAHMLRRRQLAKNIVEIATKKKIKEATDKAWKKARAFMRATAHLKDGKSKKREKKRS